MGSFGRGAERVAHSTTGRPLGCLVRLLTRLLLTATSVTCLRSATAISKGRPRRDRVATDDSNAGAVPVLDAAAFAQVTFVSDGAGGWQAPARVLATLVYNPDGTFNFTRRARERFVFDAAG